MSDADATIKALVRALEKAHGKKKPLPAIPERPTPSDPAACELPGRETSETTETGSAA